MKMAFEFSCYAGSFHDLTRFEALGTAARLGFRYVDLVTGTQLSLTRAVDRTTRDEFLEEIQQDLSLFNLQMADFHVHLPRISINDEEKRMTDIAMFLAVLPFAKALNTPGITLSPGLLHSTDDKAAQERTIEALKEMTEAANSEDIIVSIEPQPDSMAQTPEQINTILDAIPGLQLTLDMAFLEYQQIADDTWLEWLPHVRHIQVRQADAERLQAPYDSGTIDLKHLVESLVAAGYAGRISFELLSADETQGIPALNTVYELLRLRDGFRDFMNNLSIHDKS